MSENIFPHNNEAEEAVLGSLLIGGDMSHLSLEPLDFYNDAMATMYQSCLNVNSRGAAIDQITISDDLSRNDKLKAVGGVSILSKLIANTPTSLDLPYYADIVKRLSHFRQMINAGNKITQMGFDAKGDIENNLKRADNFLLELRKSSSETQIIYPEERSKRQIDRYIELYREDKTRALPFGLIDLDYELGGGIYPGDLIVVGARPGVGKTTFMQQMANVTADKNMSVLFASGEMNEDSLTDRDIASELRVPITTIRYGEYDGELFDKIIKATEALSKRPVYIFEGSRTNTFTTSNLYQSALKLKLRVGLKLIVVDYLGLLRDRYGNNQNDRLGYISAELKTLAMELKVPVICAHQLNREPEKREIKTPQLHDLRESGNIEQDADVVLFLYRENYYGGESKTTDILIAKQRQGTGNDNRKISVFFDNNDNSYKNLIRE